VRIGLVQQSAGTDSERNVERATLGVREAAGRGAALVCLQELFRTRYFAQTEDARWFDQAEPIPGPTSERFAKLARELSVVIVVPLFERRAPGLFHNSAAVLDADGRLAQVYRKLHIPDDPLFLEKYYFAPGDTPIAAVDTAAGRIGLLICWDQWFPEAARLAALDGAELLLYPSAIGWIESEGAEEHAAQLDSWMTVQRGHAIANGVFVAAVNRVGREDDLTFWGSSFVCDPQGRVLATAARDREEVLVVDCPPERIEAQRRAWPFLRDRRVDAYADLLRRYRR
jgi:N-carbamoylputrescine amidase